MKYDKNETTKYSICGRAEARLSRPLQLQGGACEMLTPHRIFQHRDGVLDALTVADWVYWNSYTA